jgi:hypothetical protein
MDSRRFDALTQRLAVRRSRRGALKGGAGLAAAGLLAPQFTRAQDATPAATPAWPADPHPSADSATTHPDYLFVQSFSAGTWASTDTDGVYTLTLTGAAAHTIYFSDRPERDTGLAPNQSFLDGLGFEAENPPNAALVVQTDSGEEDVLVVELLAPVYDADTATLTYEARVLRDYGGRGLADLAQQQTDYELPASFGEGNLFIDDCPNSLVDGCYTQYPNNGSYVFYGYIQSGECWNSSTWLCEPCASYSSVCNSTYPDCEDACQDDIAICGQPDCNIGNQ